MLWAAFGSGSIFGLIGFFAFETDQCTEVLNVTRCTNVLGSDMMGLVGTVDPYLAGGVAGLLGLVGPPLYRWLRPSPG